MSARCRISVIVPSFDRPEQVGRLVDQLGAQTVPPEAYEVIVVDDGSRADLRAVLEPRVVPFRLTVRRQPNAGSSAARQHGAELAVGELLLFVDDDMSIGPTFLQAHLDAHGTDEPLVVLGRRRAGAGWDRLSVLERYRVTMGDRLADDVRNGSTRLGGVHLYTGNVSMPRALFERVGGFDPELREIGDVDLGVRLERAGARFVLSDAAGNVHDRDPMSTRQWLARGRRDGEYWARVGRKNASAAQASPWYWLDLVPRPARPLLAASALAPAAAGALAGVGLAGVRLAGAAGREELAMSGASFVWAVQMFRGVGREAGDGAAALREYRDYRRRFHAFLAGEDPAPSPFRELLDAVREDHRALGDVHRRYDPRWQDRDQTRRASLVNSGFQIVLGYRLMRCMRALGLPLAAQVVSRGLRHAFGADIHWDAELAPGLVVVHGFGLSVSHAARTGAGCILSQNVTLGLGRDGAEGTVGAPHLGRNVSVGPGTALLGPIVVGDGTKISANCTVTQSIPAQSVVEPAPVSIRRR